MATKASELVSVTLNSSIYHDMDVVANIVRSAATGREKLERITALLHRAGYEGLRGAS